MPHDIPTNPSTEEAAGSNGHQLRSLDFRGQHELDWDRIEMEIHAIAMRAMAVEIVGRGAVESVHGISLTDVFEFLAEDISGDIERLKELLGLGREARS